MIKIKIFCCGAVWRWLAGTKVSQALVCRYVCRLILSFELVVILPWHALFPEYISFHVSLAVSQDLRSGEGG